MKKKSYAGPIIVSLVGISACIILFFLLVAQQVQAGSGYYNIDNTNNIIEFVDSGEVRIYAINPDYEYEVTGNGDDYSFIVNVIEYEEIVAAYEVRLANVKPSMNLDIDLGGTHISGFFTDVEIATISSETEGLILIDVVLIEGTDVDFTLILDETEFLSTGIYENLLVYVGLFTFIGALVYFIIVFNNRSKIRKEEEAKNPMAYERKSLYVNPIEVLVNTDKLFCEQSQTSKVEAWMKFTSQNATMGSEKDLPFIKGKEAIEESITKIYQLENLEFKWKPTMAFISDDGTLGVTIGLYKRSFLEEGETVNQRGKYISVWKNINGAWRIVFDMGN